MAADQDVPARVLVVWCPDWPVTAAGLDAATPGAVVAGSLVEACSAAARAGGVRRGQRVRDAQRHCPELVLRDRDPDAEGRLFESVAAAVAGVTPWVEVVRPGICAIPVHGAARYHGTAREDSREDAREDEEALRIHVQDTVVELGFDCGAGVADGLFAAELAARAGEGGVVVPAGGTPEFLAPYPVSVLGRPELAAMYEWIRPEIIVPVHGEMRHMTEQARFARARGIPHGIVQKNGDLIRLAPNGPEKLSEERVGRLVLDGDVILPADGDTINQRRRLAHAGLISVAVPLDDAGRDQCLHERRRTAAID